MASTAGEMHFSRMSSNATISAQSKWLIRIRGGGTQQIFVKYKAVKCTLTHSVICCQSAS